MNDAAELTTNNRFDAVDAETLEVLKGRVCETSRNSYAIRKGAATHMATGSTACPPIASICLRANWAMPGVLNRCIKYENAGDQFVGKCVSGRSRKSKEFAASPPCWDFSAEGWDAMVFQYRLHSWLRDHLPEEAKDNLKVLAVYKTQTRGYLQSSNCSSYHWT